MNNCTGEERTEDDRTVRKVLYTYDRVGRLVRKEVVRNLTDMFRRKQERPCAGRSRSRSCIIMGKRQRRCTAGSKRCMTIPESRRRADCLIRVRRAGKLLTQTG
ncbi:hypothetical protein [Roseburia intestinalis]|uniref:hypothetical protein n=1 Tax=Roseburia intestinalis TaxID=166486 RepID=UPI00351FA8DF